MRSLVHFLSVYRIPEQKQNVNKEGSLLTNPKPKAKKAERQLLDVVAIGQPVIPQDVAIVPEFLDELGGLIGHVGMTF